MTDVTGRVGQLSPEKRALLQKTLLAAPRANQPGGRIPRRNGTGTLGAPLSFAQERMWFFHRFQPTCAAYNIPLVYSLRGPLDVGALAEAMGHVVSRHEALRTTFRETPEGPVQIVGPALPVEVPVRTLVAPEEERDREALRLATEEVRRPFNLETGPLYRVSLCRLGPEEHLFVLVMHHIVSDGWSMQVFFRELSLAYSSLRSGGTVALPELPIQYADFAAWQREYLNGPALRGQLDYWRKRLAGAPAALELPADRPRPPVETYRGARLCFTVPGPLAEGLRAFSRETGSTLFITLLASFMALLGRYSRQRDIVVGTPIASRNRSEIEGLIGLFVNSLAMRGDLSGNPTFRDFVDRVKETAVGAYDNQDLPFEALVGALHPQRSLSRQPVYQVMFAHQPAPGSAFAPAGLECRRVVVDTGESLFDMTMSLDEHSGGLEGTLVYSTDLFDAGTVEGMIDAYGRILEDVVARPSERLSELPTLTEKDRHRILVEWNDTRREYPRQETVHGLFEAMAASRPDRVALVWDGQRPPSRGLPGTPSDLAELTYGQLDRWADRIAASLEEAEAGLETPIGVCLERSPDMVAALLGVLKAGGFYVPLDPAYPAERLDFVMKDAGVEVIVAREEEASRYAGVRAVVALGAGGGVSVRRAEPGLSGSAATKPSSGVGHPAVDARNLAYSVYTSGSTGIPKAVAVSHQAVVRLVKAANFARLDENEVFLQLAPVNFDASTLEIWGALLNGARLAIAPPGDLSLTDLGHSIRRLGVTILWLTAGLFNVMLDEQPEALAGLRQLLFGGEAASRAHVQKALRVLPGVTLINGYGPTENTTFTTTARVGCPERDPGASLDGPVPIGRPISNTTVYVLGENFTLCPPGVPGELYTGGDGLARGYLGRPDLTAERFVPHPFGAPGERLYRTGDLVRRLPGGDIDFLARLDFQVKLRGFRIELGEIEATLRTHPEVKDCVAVLREDAPGDKKLLAYATVRSGQSGTRADLRTYLAGKVPDYMVPAAVVVLDGFPLGPAGKIDRAALPAPDYRAMASGDGEILPRTGTEKVLAGFWSELLRQDQVAVNRDFFELGGHSLLATQLVSRIRRAMGVEIPLRAVFESPTIEGLAALIDERRGQARAAREAAVDATAAATMDKSGAGAAGDELPARVDELSARVDELSDSEVDSLIKYLLEKERGD